MFEAGLEIGFMREPRPEVTSTEVLGSREGGTLPRTHQACQQGASETVAQLTNARFTPTFRGSPRGHVTACGDARRLGRHAHPRRTMKPGGGRTLKRRGPGDDSFWAAANRARTTAVQL
jgi:hypothetical protein